MPNVPTNTPEQFVQGAPLLLVPDVPATAAFYRTILGVKSDPGPPDAEIEYVLGNGQVDRYPASWAYSQREVCAALESFARSRRVSGISWFNDSEDGSQHPEQYE